MNTGNRITTIIMSKVNKLLNKHEDPREVLDLSYEKQLELLNNIRKGIAEIVTAKNQLENRKRQLCSDVINIDDNAKELLKQGNEPLAREVLERGSITREQIDSLTVQIKKLRTDQDKLVEREKVLEIRIEQFKSTKETMKAQYSAAEASSKIAESLTGIGDSVGNVGDAMRRTEDKTQTMNARASAIGELVDEGVLDDSLGTESKIDRELNKSKRKGKVDNQIENMKKELGLKSNDLNSVIKK